MGYCLTRGFEWTAGYRFCIYHTTYFGYHLKFFTSSLEKNKEESEQTHSHIQTLKLSELIHISGAKPALLAFFAYCSLEGATRIMG